MYGACAHGRAYEYYIESINRQKFFAFECDSLENLQKGNCSVVNGLVRMGAEPGNKFRRGIYYLQTNDKSEFSRGQAGVLRTLATKASAKTSKYAYFSYAYMSSFFTWTENTQKHYLTRE